MNVRIKEKEIDVDIFLTVFKLFTVKLERGQILIVQKNTTRVTKFTSLQFVVSALFKM